MFEFLTNLFDRESFAIAFSDNSVRAVQLGYEGKSLKVKAVGERNLAPEIVQAGLILNQKALAKEILLLLNQTKPAAITAKGCYLVLSERQTFEAIFYLPASLDDKQFNAELDKLVAASIPLPFHEVKYDYSIAFCGKLKIVSVVAAKREVIAQYYQVIKEVCQLKPLGLEPVSASLVRNLNFDFKLDQGHLILDLSADKILWFSLWQDNVFDSNIIFNNELDDNFEILLTDLKQAITNFKNKTKREVKKILITGDQDKLVGLQDSLASLNIPVDNVEYKLKNNWPIVTGGALKPYINNKDNIDLFKKI
jgi:Tfp pilus assembly PilM family ATPase